MADDESLEGRHNLALQPVNIPPRVKLMLTLATENALDRDDILDSRLQSITHNH